MRTDKIMMYLEGLVAGDVSKAVLPLFGLRVIVK